MLGKVCPVTPLLSSVFERSLLCVLLVGFAQIYLVATVEYLINLQWRRCHRTKADISIRTLYFGTCCSNKNLELSNLKQEIEVYDREFLKSCG